MPKRSIEINKFIQGIISTPSNTDTDINSAKYSKNIDPAMAQGRLQGIDGDKHLSNIGFVDETLTSSVSVDSSNMITTTDKKSTDRINLISIKTTAQDTIDTVQLFSNIYGSSVASVNLSSAISSVPGEHSLTVDDSKVFIGTGGSAESPSKVVMQSPQHKFNSGEDGDINIYNSALTPPSVSHFLDGFSEYMTFSIHGTTPDGTAISYDDSAAAAFYADYDVVADINGSNTLYTALTSGTYGTSGSLNGLKVGQIFKCHDAQDTHDNALAAWKQYDYDDSANSVAAGDLFMFCGYIDGTDSVPILRFLGNADAIGGAPAFAYAFKEDDSSLYKISLTTTADTTAFDSSTTNSVKGADGQTHTLTNVGSRITSVDLRGVSGFDGNYVSAISACHSPLLYNQLNLEGALDPHTTASTSIYYNNGHLKYLYRHGVFYVSARNRGSTLFRVNAIDFHQLSETQVRADILSLDFTNIPNQLHAENSDGIVQRTLEDQLIENQYDPKAHNGSWSRIPTDAYILGICETFESGIVSSVSSHVNTWSNNAFKITTEQKSRLASGDKVRFANMNVSASANDTFNTSAPYEVSVVDDGDSFYVLSSHSTDSVPATTANNNLWWNAKVWVLYGRRDESASFNDWDLFLYNANTLDTTPGKTIYMADRTVPYHQARYYEALTRTPSDYGDTLRKMHYPGEFAFVKKGTTSGTQLTSAEVALPASNITTTGPNNQGDGVYTDAYCQLGIYDKSGRWTINGGKTQINAFYDNNEFAGAHVPVEGAQSTEANCISNLGLRGNLYIGDNIGWDIDEGRKIWPVQNSLQPQNPYSRLYMGSEVYQGYNRSDLDEISLSSDNFNVDSFQSAGQSFHNRPKHAVTFIGRVHGDFVVQPSVLTRAQNHMSWDSEDNNPPVGIANNGTWINSHTSEFRINHVDAEGGDGVERIDSYRGENTLFTIDDFSGHRGCCIDDDANATDATNATASGITIGHPNWGGPEIENPLFKADADYSGGMSESEPVVYSSVNGGTYTTHGDSTDKGWDGYSPPRLFTPGKGYYVYINRAWRSQCAAPFSEGEGGGIYGNRAGNEGALPLWGFQAGGTHWFHQNVTKEWYANRFFNFSSTAIADNRYKYPMNNNGAGYAADMTMVNTLAAVSQKYLAEGGGYQSSRFYGDNNYYPYIGWPSFGSAVCTMNKLDIPELGKINNIFPVILDTKVTATGDTAEFFAGYLCGITTKFNNNSRIMFLRTNLDPVFNKILTKQCAPHSTIHDREFYQKILRLQDTPQASGSNIEGYRILMESGTSVLEVAPITSVDTGRRDNSPYPNSITPGLRQAAIDSSMSSVIGGEIKAISQKPIEDNLDNLDLIVEANASDSSNTYIGKEANKATIAYSTGASSVDSDGPYADITGTFASSDWTASSDSDILTTLSSFVSFTSSTETTNAPLSAGVYSYKITFLYDNKYESPLVSGAPMTHTLTAASSTSGGTWDYITITATLPESLLLNISDRVTGIIIYRKFGGGDEDDYSLVKELKFDDTWSLSGTNYTATIIDDGNLGWSYESVTGLPQTIENSSLNYGLSTRYQGYLYVSKAWHPELTDVQNYIFRSLPNNPFAFNWTSDFLIMPEKPIAMTSFNSRLFVWGKNKLYKIDPMSLVIEDEYEGISIASTDSFAVTEYGLCFLDENNIYLHDGNIAKPIANDILHTSNDSITYDGTNYNRIKQGYRELIKDTLDAGYKPKVFYSGIKSSFIVLLYSSSGLAFSYNVNHKRWDLWDAPIPKGATYSQNGDILISDGTKLYQYLSNTSNASSSSEDYSYYRKEDWDWFSNDLNFGSDAQEKVFKSISMFGTPSIYDFSSSLPAIYDSSSDTKRLSVQAFVDDKAVALTVKNKFYDTIRIGNAINGESIGAGEDVLSFIIKNQINNSESSYDRFEFIRPGHLIKIDDEIMLVTETSFNTEVGIWDIEYNTTNKLTVKRAVMGTTIASHSTSQPIYVVAPKLSFPGGTKGNRLKLQLQQQRGYIDTIQVSYKPKSIK